MVGQLLGHYRIESVLGAGGMGVVYRAHDTRLDRPVAIKVLTGLTLDRTPREALMFEARAASALNHPSICTIYEVGETDDRLFLVMELVEGRSLQDLIPPEGLALDTAVRYAIHVASAVAHAHEHGVVHRDLKSANIRITPDGRIKVLDFGLATRALDLSIDTATRSRQASDACVHCCRNARLHGAGSAARRDGRCTQRQLGAGRAALRDVDGAPPFYRPLRVRNDDGDSARPAATAR